MDSIQPAMPNETPMLRNSELEMVVGDTGTERYHGYFAEEPNTKWRNETRIDTVYEMRTSDAAVKAALRALKSPILSVEWSVFSYKDDKKSEEIRQFVEDNIFHMKRPWKKFLREALGFLEFGFYPFEQLYEIRDGMVWLKDLSPRIPRSIQAWANPTTKERGILQNVRTDEVKNVFEQKFIPMWKLLVLTNEMEGDDITGQSELRAAFLHWKMKNMMYRLDGISKDRYGVGIPTVKLPENYTPAQQAKAEDLAQNVRSSDKGYMVLPPGFEFDIKTPDGKGVDMMPSIAHHNRMVLLSTLSQFLDLGSGDTGSFALSQNQIEFLMQNCEEKACYVQEDFTLQVIKPLVDLNFGEQEWYPELHHMPIEAKDLEKSSVIIKNLVDSGALVIDPEFQKWVRPAFKYPEMQDDQIEEDEVDETGDDDEVVDPANPDKPVVDENMKTIDARVALSNQPLKFFRKLTGAESVVDFKKLNQGFNDTENSFEDAMTALTVEGLYAYASNAQKKIEDEDLAGISTLSFPILEKTRAAIGDAVRAAYGLGKSSASNELDTERPTTSMQDKQLMAMDIENWAQTYQFELDKHSREFIKNAYISDAGAAAIISALQPSVKDFASKMIANMSNGIVESYVGTGRNAVFEENLPDIAMFQRSEVLDSRTCNMCLSLDKRVVKADDPMRRLNQVHNCCRGVWIAIKQDDPNAPTVTGVPKSVSNAFQTVDGKPQMNAFKQLKKPINATNQEVQDIIRSKMDE